MNRAYMLTGPSTLNAVAARTNPGMPIKRWAVYLSMMDEDRRRLLAYRQRVGMRGPIEAGDIMSEQELLDLIQEQSGMGGEQWQQIVSFITTWGSGVAAYLGIGPSYDSHNGGEVMRQLEYVGNRPWVNAYCEWLKTYAPAIWDTGDIWTSTTDLQNMGINPYANNSFWKDRYFQLVAAGMPEGCLVDGNMIPVGLADAVAAAGGEDVDPTVQPSTTDGTKPTEGGGSGFGTVLGLLSLFTIFK